MNIRTTIRLCWHPESASMGRSPVLYQMLDAGFSREAWLKVAADKVECTAEIEIDNQGNIKLISVRLSERCQSTNDQSGLGLVQCTKMDCHDSMHGGAYKTEHGIASYFWKREN